MSKASQLYHQLEARRTREPRPPLAEETRILSNWVPFVLHPNAIWHHRVLTEIVVQVWEDNGAPAEPTDLADLDPDNIRRALKRFGRVWSTRQAGPSNKSATHFLAQAVLEQAVEGQPREGTWNKLLEVYRTLVHDGPFREGVHYAVFTFDPLLRAYEYLGRPAAVDELLQQVGGWLRAAAGEKGEIAQIGDGWPEYVENYAWLAGLKAPPPTAHLQWRDMDILRQGDWVVVQHHRRTKFTWHEQPHGAAVMAAHRGRWILPGPGIPSYDHKLRRPWRWDRPHNNWTRETAWDAPVLWHFWRSRLYRPGRHCSVEDGRLIVIDEGRATLRWPGTEPRLADNRAVWEYDGFRFEVEARGSGAPRLAASSAFITTGYKKWERLPVVRVSGRDLHTTVTPLDGQVGD